MKKYILPIFVKNFFTPSHWVFVVLLLVSNSVFPAGDKLEFKLLQIIPKRSGVNQMGEAQSGKKKRSPQQRRSPKKITGSTLREITENSTGTRSPGIGHISDSIIQKSIEEIPRVGEISNNTVENPNLILFDTSDNSEEGPSKIVPYVDDISDKPQKPNPTLNGLLPLNMLIALEQQNVEIRNVAEKFTQFIINGDIKGYRRLLDYILTRRTPLQVFIIFQVITTEGNTLLHWMSTVHSKEWNQELKYMLEAFGVYNEQSGDSFQEMRKEIALTELDQDNLWEAESVTDLNNFEPAVLLSTQQIQDYYSALNKELLTPGNTRLFLSTITGKTQTGVGFFDLVKKIKAILSPNNKFITEIRQLTKLLTPPLYIKNQKGLTPLQMALHTSKNRKNGTIAILSRAEATIRIDTNTVSSVNSNRYWAWGTIGIGTTVAIGATCAYMFY